MVYNGHGLSGGGCTKSFPLAFLFWRVTKGDGAFMGIAFAILWQVVMETYTALAADIPFVIAVAQAALQLLRRKAST